MEAADKLLMFTTNRVCFPVLLPFPNSLIMFPIQSGLFHPLWIKTIFDFVCSVPSVNVHKSKGRGPSFNPVNKH